MGDFDVLAKCQHESCSIDVEPLRLFFSNTVHPVLTKKVSEGTLENRARAMAHFTASMAYVTGPPDSAPAPPAYPLLEDDYNKLLGAAVGQREMNRTELIFEPRDS